MYIENGFHAKLYPRREQVNFQWDDDEVRFVWDQYAYLDFYMTSSLKQQSTDRHVASLRANQSFLYLLNVACLALQSYTHHLAD
jgi:hypothetical protein